LPSATSQFEQAHPLTALNRFLKLDFKAAIYYNGADNLPVKVAAELFTGGIP